MEAFAILETTARVHDAVDALVSESIDGFSTDALGADVIDIRREIERLEAEFLRRLHRFDRGNGAGAEGVGTVSWLRAGCSMTGRAAAYRVHLARTLGDIPAALDRARDGRASLSNVTMIAHLAKEVGVEQLAPYEDILVTSAETFEPHQMRRLTQEVQVRVDPDGKLAKDNHAHEQRWFSCDETYGGVFVLRGELDAEGGALVKQAIDSMSPGVARGEVRAASTRRADALVELAATQLRCGDLRDVHGQRPHLTVTVSPETLHSDTRPPDVKCSDALRSDTRHANRRPAMLDGVGPIHPESARRIACDAVRTLVTVAPLDGAAAWATITPIVPLSVGRATRTIPASIRTALVLRDQGCRFPGCDRPPAWTDGHHIIHWADGGPTELGNLVSLCRQHHRRVHEERWRIQLVDGIAVIEPPP